MTTLENTKTCLIISFGPTPTPKYQKIEGGGQRCWGLAQGLKAQGYEVTVGIHRDFPLDVTEVNGIHLVNWSEDEQFASQINTFDNLIISYSMGGPMTYVVDHLSDHVTLILDCYVPIYIEVSARDSHDKSVEYSNYSHDILHWNKALKRGDYFLCANEPQRHLYTGVLAALDIINPFSYKTERILLVPFGIESSLDIANKHNPYLGLGIKKDDFVLLWFGGLYPWFNIKPLLSSIKSLSGKHKNFKFVIVGGKNPYNNHPDFVKQYKTTHAFMEENKLIDTSVYFVDWVDFSDRINWYQNASVVISINNVGNENIYSWRTRVMDYVWGGVPMLTNGGDPLSNSLIAVGAAIKLKDTEATTLESSIAKLMKDNSVISDARKELTKQREAYYWERVVVPIDEALKLDQKPFLSEKIFKDEFHPDTIEIVEASGMRRKIRKLARAPRKVAGLVRRKGVKRSAQLVLKTIGNRAVKTVQRNEKRYYFFSHPIDHTGAPQVLLDIIDDYVKKVKKVNVDLVYPGGEKDLLRRVFRLGILTDKMVLGIGSRVIHAQLGVQKNDFVLLNTVAVYPNYRDYVLGLLERGKLNKATWFIHEDMPELRFDDKGLIARIKRLVAAGLIEIIVPSEETATDYNRFFETDTIRAVTLRVGVPEEYIKPRDEKEYSTLRFVISGTPSDGRKGQLLAISAFSKYLGIVNDTTKKNYRDFELDLISIGDDYISRQIRSIGDGLLGKHVHYYPQVKKLEAMKITHLANVTICSSLNETFALFVAEGMLMHHVILRNNSSGMTSQLQDGKNGYLIDSNDIDDFSQKIERLLNKTTTSNRKLKQMGDRSRTIAGKFIDSNYYDQLSN
jgi:glycosyltransferase involved in cell wall biosynthesis